MGSLHCGNTATTQGIHPGTPYCLHLSVHIPLQALLKNVTLDHVSVQILRGKKICQKYMKSWSSLVV